MGAGQAGGGSAAKRRWSEPTGAAGEPAPEDAAGRALGIAPSESVYSYFMFVMPVESARAPGRFTWNKLLACSLVLVTLLLQGVLLYAIFDKVVGGDIAWRDGIVGRTGGRWSPFSSSSGGAAAPPCNTGGSLCTRSSNGTFSCAPPSVQLTGRWEELDLDGDGTWTREEAEEAREALRCKYAVDPVEVFGVFVSVLLQREAHVWIHPALRAGREIRRAYFVYASGDLVMCGYRSGEMCANLLARHGVFDAPLRYGTAPRVGRTIDSALDYCYGLLEPGGVCERTLPSTYSVWRKSSERQCRGAQYVQAVYAHPVTGAEKSMLTVDYQARQDYSRVEKSALFFTYKAIIIGAFLLAMYAELRQVALQAAWVALFPAAGDVPGEAVVLGGAAEDGSEPATCRICGVSRAQRAAVALLTMARAAVLGVLTVVGVTFLQKDTDWINLLLNGVAMVFVAEIATSLYAQAVSPWLRERCEATEVMEVPMRAGILERRPGAGDLAGLLALAAAVVVIMSLHFALVGRPLSEALGCACLGEGPRCDEAQRFSRGFWREYWRREVPAALAEVGRLRDAAAAAGRAAGAAAPQRRRGAGARPGRRAGPRAARMLNEGRA